MKRICLSLIAAGLLTTVPGNCAETVEGLLLTLQSGESRTVTATAGADLFVPAGAPPSPLLPAGSFTAEWTGAVNADLRGDYRFKAVARGTVKVEINGKVVLEGSGTGQAFVGPSEEVRLGKGENPLRVTFLSPTDGDAFVRLLWSEYGFLWEPIDPVYLTRGGDPPALTAAERILRGRELFLNRRCVRCHTLDGTGVPELKMDAPALDGIGSRRRVDWLVRWIENPHAERSDARMPGMLARSTKGSDARDIATYLATLTDKTKGLNIASEESGVDLIANLHCVGCHTLPGAEPEPQKISLTHVNEKFPPGYLARFLVNPTEHYQWRRMPDFKLRTAEAVAIANALRHGAPAAVEMATKGDATKGRRLLISTGCLNCHELTGSKSTFATRALPDLRAGQGGCVVGGEGLPDFGFNEDERAALMAFLETDRSSLRRHVPAEFAARQSRDLNCRSCHGELDGFPPYERLGGKLKPEYMAELIAGKVPESPRPWLAHVMPKFPVVAETLAKGLAHSHGYPSRTPAEPPVDQKLAGIGRRLVGVEGGFSCISCHGVGDLQPTQVFEAEGINLALPARRLQRDYYFRWLLNPLKIEPQTKMPVYFDEEGNSPLYDVLDGKAIPQLEAFWHYMRAGDAIKPPDLPGF